MSNIIALIAGYLSVISQILWQITMVNCHNLAPGPNSHCGKNADARRLLAAPATANEGLEPQRCHIDTV